MTPSRLGRARTVGLLVGAICTFASLANAQPPAPSLPRAEAETAAFPVEAAATAPGGTTPEAVAPPEGPPPHRPPSYPKTLLLDTGYVLSAPARWSGREWLALSASAAALATLSVADEPLSEAARDHGPTFGAAGAALEELGGAGALVLLGGFYLGGAIGKDAKAKNVCLDGLAAALIANGMITPLVSTLVGRERPTAEQGAYAFHPFEGRSFPSGHATQAFAVASVIATSYDSAWVKAAAYGAAAVTAYERVRRGKHFPTDVVAGAAIGTLVGRSVVRFNRKLRSGEREREKSGTRLTILPRVGGGTYGVSATLEF